METTEREARQRLREQLARILRDADFRANPRTSAFLAHIVEKALDGRQDEIKEATIGVEVFHRRPGYDNRSDSIVRTEARRLRQKLSQYYLGAGENDPFRIEIPRGSYVPQFHPTGVAQPLRQPRRIWRRVAALALLTAAPAGIAIWSHRRRAAALPPIRTIAVLPFAGAGPHTHYQYLGDGLAEDLQRDLSRLKQLRIRANPPGEWLEPRQRLDYRSLSRRLAVDAVLDGEIVTPSGRPEIHASLIRGSDASILWTDRFEPGAAVGVVETEIEQAVAKTLGLSLPALPRPENPQAHDLFLEGRNLWATQGKAESQQAIALYQRALKLDPNYALAYMGIADTYGLMTVNGLIEPREGIAKGELAARKAIQLDPGLAEAHAALGLLKTAAWDWNGAEHEYRQAIGLNPSYGRAYERAGVLRFYAGDFPGAERMMRQAETLSPYSLLLPLIRAELYYYWRRYDESVKLIRRVQTVDARNVNAFALLARDFLAEGRAAEALESARKLAHMAPGRFLELAECLAAVGRTADARRLMARALKSRSFNPYVLAVAYAGMKDQSQALEWLARALAGRTPDLPSARWEPAFDFVRGDPRFQTIIAKVMNSGPR
jgi:TolB-like protein